MSVFGENRKKDQPKERKVYLNQLVVPRGDNWLDKEYSRLRNNREEIRKQVHEINDAFKLQNINALAAKIEGLKTLYVFMNKYYLNIMDYQDKIKSVINSAKGCSLDTQVKIDNTKIIHEEMTDYLKKITSNFSSYLYGKFTKEETLSDGMKKIKDLIEGKKTEQVEGITDIKGYINFLFEVNKDTRGHFSRELFIEQFPIKIIHALKLIKELDKLMTKLTMDFEAHANKDLLQSNATLINKVYEELTSLQAKLNKVFTRSVPGQLLGVTEKENLKKTTGKDIEKAELAKLNFVVRKKLNPEEIEELKNVVKALQATELAKLKLVGGNDLQPKQLEKFKSVVGKSLEAKELKELAELNKIVQKDLQPKELKELKRIIGIIGTNVIEDLPQGLEQGLTLLQKKIDGILKTQEFVVNVIIDGQKPRQHQITASMDPVQQALYNLHLTVSAPKKAIRVKKEERPDILITPSGLIDPRSLTPLESSPRLQGPDISKLRLPIGNGLMTRGLRPIPRNFQFNDRHDKKLGSAKSKLTMPASKPDLGKSKPMMPGSKASSANSQPQPNPVPLGRFLQKKN